MTDIDHPGYYGGNGIEAIDVIESWSLGFHLGNVVKYVSRAGKKPGTEAVTDLRKAAWYLNRVINRLEREQ